MAGAVLERLPSLEILNQAVSAGRQVQNDNFKVLSDTLLVQPERKKTFEERTLQEEIDHLRNNWQKENLPENWIDLPGVGFMIGYQVGFLDSEKFKPFSLEEKKQKWTKLTESSLKSWTMEYLAQKGVLPGLQTLEFEDGRWKYKDDLHGAGLELDETLSKKEGGGVVWDTYINKIKPFFINGTSAVVDSPSGKRMPDEKGNLIEFPDSRLTVMQKKGKNIFTYTIANDFDYQEHVELMNELRKEAGQEDAGLTKNSTGEDFIANPALFKDSSISVSKVLTLMSKIREKKGTAYLYKNKTAQDLIEESKNWHAMWNYDDITEKFVKEFVDYSLQGNWTKDTLQEALATTILRLSKYVLAKEKEKKRVAYENRSSVTYYNDQSARAYDYSNRSDYMHVGYGGNYGVVFAEVRAIPGCAGGGRKEGSFQVGFDRAYNALFGEEEKFTCPKCSKTAEGKVGNKCPNCGITKEEWAQESGVVCD